MGSNAAVNTAGSCWSSFPNAWGCFIHQDERSFVAEGVIIAAITLLVICWEPFIKPFFLWIGKVITSLWDKVTGKQALQQQLQALRAAGIPPGSLQIVPIARSTWQLGNTANGDPILILDIHLSVTNCYGHATEIPRVYIDKPRQEATVSVKPNPIQPQNASALQSLCSIQPPPKVTQGKPFDADVVVVDQWGIEHKTKVSFRPLR